MLSDGSGIVDDFDVRSVAPGTVARVAKRVGYAPDGAPVTYPLIVVAGIARGPTVTLVGGIHGDEYEGPAALWRVMERINPLLMRGRVVIVPVAHLAAFSAGTRTSPVDNANLARSFPGDAAGTITYRLARDIFETVVRAADIVIDLHSGGVRLAFVQVAGFYAAGGGVSEAVAARSLALARGMRLPWIWQMPARAGVLSFEAARANVAVAGCEAGGRGGCAEADVAAYTNGILGILADNGLIEPTADLPRVADPDSALDGDFLPAPVSGFLDPLVTLGARVQAGEALAVIRAPSGIELTRLRAETDGVVMAERHLRMIHAGEWATCAVRELTL